MFKDDLLKDKRILVTGGGTGLGKEMATHFARHGAQVYICGRRGNVLEDTANELKEKYDVDIKHEPLDIRSPQDVDDYIGRIFDEGPLDGLVNNAAGNFISPSTRRSRRARDGRRRRRARHVCRASDGDRRSSSASSARRDATTARAATPRSRRAGRGVSGESSSRSVVFVYVCLCVCVFYVLKGSECYIQGFRV